MQDRKFLTLLRTLDKMELTAFHRHLKQLRGKEEIALSVFTYLKAFHPHFRDDRKLDIAYAYKKIFKSDIAENDYNRTKILNALSDLHLWLQDFLVFEKVKGANGSFTGRVLWLTVLQEKGLGAEFSKQATRLHDEVQGVPQKRLKDYQKKLISNYYFYQHFAEDQSSLNIETLLNCVHEIDISYAVTRLKMACEIESLKNLLPSETEPKAPPAVFDWSALPASANHPLLLLYQEVYQLIAADRTESFSRLESLLSDYAKDIDPEELHVLLRLLHNYATGQLRKSKEEYWRRTHQLNKLSAEYGVFTRDGTMSATQFHNIVNAACRAGDLDWAKSFIAAHRIYLPKATRHKTVLLADAILLFEKKEFEKTIQTLEGVIFKEPHDIIRSKALMLRGYYETKAGENEILDFCKSFALYLERNRKPRSEAVEATFNFLRLVRMLVRKKTGKDILLHEIETAVPLYFKTWLLEKTAGYKDEFAARKRSL